MKTVLLTGSNGLIGRRIYANLTENGYKVIKAVHRTKIKNNSLNNTIEYTKEKIFINKNKLLEIDYVIHLAGASIISKRWSKKRKKEIIESRTCFLQNFYSLIEKNPHKIKTIISASAIGYYAPSTKLQTENAPSGNSFLSEVCKLWESNTTKFTKLGIRAASIRTPIVISKESGFIKKQKVSLSFGIMGLFGFKSQVISWICLSDLVKIYIEAINNNSFKGQINACSNSSKTLEEIGTIISRNKFTLKIRIPIFLLKIVLGKRYILLTESYNIKPSEIISKYNFNKIEDCIF